MPVRRWPRRGSKPRGSGRPGRKAVFLLLAVLVLAGAVVCTMVFRSLITDMAVSSAKDVVVTAVNDIVKQIMTDGSFDASDLVELQKDDDGNITAITTNVAEANYLAAEVIARAVEDTSDHVLTVSVPIGNLVGSAIFLNRGPSIKVQVVMLSSSVGSFRSELTSAGINQTRHQIILDLNVQLSLLMPWRKISTSVETEVLVSETVVVGEVPDSYLYWEY